MVHLFDNTKYIATVDKAISIVGSINTKEKEDDITKFVYMKGYVDEDENVWLFAGTSKPKSPNQYPYFWINENGEKEFSNPDKEVKALYNANNMLSMDVVDIVKNTNPNEKLFDEQEIEDINAASSKFAPEIKEDDDFLKKAIKAVIAEKGIDINKLKSKTEKKYVLSNMRSALTGKTRMSVSYFAMWMDLLGTNFELTVYDDGEKKEDVLKEPIVYQNTTDKVSILVNGNLINIITKKEEEEEDE